MNIELTKEDMIAAAALGFERVLARPENQQMLADAAAAGIARMFELLSPAAAAELLGKAEVTLQRNHEEWGLDKSVAFGRETPRYFLSQIVERAKAKVIRGRKVDGGKVTEFPTSTPAKKAG